MMTDLYQLTMMYGYYKCGMRDNLATFDMFYRSKDATTHYAIMAGVEQLVEYIENLHFDEDAIAYLRSLNIFDEDFLDELRATTQAVIISDTFTQFAQPLMAKLGWPALFCNELEVADDGTIAGFRMRCPNRS